MADNGMHLRILLPFTQYMDEQGVQSIIAETSVGSLGILPHRLDCVALIKPGILSYQKTSGQEMYVAMDEGLLLKMQSEVVISVRNATAGTDLSKLQEAVEKEFEQQNEEEAELHELLQKIESSFLSRIHGLNR